MLRFIFFFRIIDGFKVMLTYYVEGLIRNMGCKTAVVVELLLPKSSEDMWAFPLYFKGKEDSSIWSSSFSLRVFFNLPFLCLYPLTKSK